jgi:hypothetical protein
MRESRQQPSLAGVGGCGRVAAIASVTSSDRRNSRRPNAVVSGMANSALLEESVNGSHSGSEFWKGSGWAIVINALAVHCGHAEARGQSDGFCLPSMRE